MRYFRTDAAARCMDITLITLSTQWPCRPPIKLVNARRYQTVDRLLRSVRLCKIICVLLHGRLAHLGFAPEVRGEEAIGLSDRIKSALCEVALRFRVALRGGVSVLHASHL